MVCGLGCFSNRFRRSAGRLLGHPEETLYKEKKKVSYSGLSGKVLSILIFAQHTTFFSLKVSFDNLDLFCFSD